jgi:hypothetical protein
VVMSVLVLLMVTWSPPGGAFHDPDGAQVLDEHVIEGPFWSAWRVNVTGPGSVVSWEIEPESEDRVQTAYGLWMVSVNDLRNPFFVLGAGGGGITELDVYKEEPVGVDVQVGPVSAATGATSSFAVTMTNTVPDEYWLVIANMMPQATTATVRLWGSPEVEMLAYNEGTEGGFYRETDFETPHPYHQVRVGFGVGLSFQAQAHHLLDGRVDASIENRLFGQFTASPRSDVRNMSIEDPNGAQEVLPFGSRVLTDRDPGDWTFHAHEWLVEPRAAMGPNAYLLAWWADVDLP